MAQSNNIKVMRKTDKDFPWYLANMKDGPEALYYIGNKELLHMRKSAVVGSRKCSEYGRQVAMKIGRTLAENRVVTVSGMAAGIDSCAHTGALAADGFTIAVLACGPDICYPPSNKKLYEKICQTGLVVSEYPPGTKAMPWQFPRRNRIISALSEAVTVVEAASSSGAIITAVAAAEQGREVLAVPGNINSPFSMGTNKLIADGATVVTVPEDILRIMGIVPAIKKEELATMGREELEIFEILQEKGEMTIDALCLELDKEPFALNGLVAVMEMKGLVSYELGKIFIAKI